MIETLDWDKLVVARWGIARANKADMGVAASMLHHNTINGQEMNPVSDIPEEYLPDWAALKAEADALGEDKYYNQRIAAEMKARDNYKALCDMWNVDDCDGMVALMESIVELVPEPEEDTEEDAAE